MDNRPSRFAFLPSTALTLSAALMLVACGDGAHQSTAQKPQHGPATVAPAKPKAPPIFALAVSQSPLFESARGWGAGYAAARAKAGGKGVIVGPGGGDPTVFAQQFPVRAGDQFKVIARASSVDKPMALARIQINWLDAGNKFISVSAQQVEVARHETAFETILTAPEGAAAATLYVAPGGKDEVVRYTEMRALGEGTPAVAVPLPETYAAKTEAAQAKRDTSMESTAPAVNPFPKPPDLTPLDGSGRALSVAESQYYFYHATKATHRKAHERGMDFIMYVMPDYSISRLMPAIKQLRAEGIKVVAYEPQGGMKSGVNENWYWQKADSHWTEAAVRLTADEILNMWKNQSVANRPFSAQLQDAYSNGFPPQAPAGSSH
jgi:hypothetical protein